MLWCLTEDLEAQLFELFTQPSVKILAPNHYYLINATRGSLNTAPHHTALYVLQFCCISLAHLKQRQMQQHMSECIHVPRRATTIFDRRLMKIMKINCVNKLTLCKGVVVTYNKLQTLPKAQRTQTILSQ